MDQIWISLASIIKFQGYVRGVFNKNVRISGFHIPVSNVYPRCLFKCVSWVSLYDMFLSFRVKCVGWDSLVSIFKFPAGQLPGQISPSPLGSRSYIEISSLRAPLIKSGWRWLHQAGDGLTLFTGSQTLAAFAHISPNFSSKPNWTIQCDLPKHS